MTSLRKSREGRSMEMFNSFLGGFLGAFIAVLMFAWLVYKYGGDDE